MKPPPGGRCASRRATIAIPIATRVGEHVGGVGEQGEGGGDDRRRQLGGDEGDDQRQGSAEAASVGVG